MMPSRKLLFKHDWVTHRTGTALLSYEFTEALPKDSNATATFFSLKLYPFHHKSTTTIRLSYVVLATVITLVATCSIEGAATVGNSVQIKTSIDSVNAANPTIEDHRFLRAHETAVAEERSLPATARLKEKLFKLKLKIVMPGIKKILTNVVEGLLK